MKNRILLLACLTILLNTNLLEAQSISGSIMHDGISRGYRLYLPSNYQNYESLPLVFNLHGFESNGAQQELYSGMNLVADTAKFFVCYAEGFKYNGVDQAWNVGWAIGSDKDDVGFISALIDTISSSYNVDLNAVFSCGMSNGGFMSYKLACDLNDRIKAIASVTGSMEPGEAQNCIPDVSIPVMQIHGTADGVVDYNGTSLISIPIEELISKWLGINNCAIPGDTIPVPDIAPTDATTAERIEYNDCDEDSRVVFYKIANGGHTWPGAFPLPVLGPTSQDFKASREIWLFFRAYTSPLIVSNKELSNVARVEAHPNPFDGFIHIESQTGNLKTIRVHNSTGQTVFYQAAINSADFRIPASGFQSGLYFINIETTEGIAVLKTIKH